MNKFIIGILAGILIIAFVVFGLSVFEEASDGPLENAAESVEETVEDAADKVSD